VEVITTFLPGINRLPPAGEGRAKVTGLFAHPGAAIPWPISYGAFARRLAQPGAIDTAVVQVSAPDAAGEVSFGPSVEFGPLALASAKRRIAVVNHRVARSRAAPTAALHDFDDVVEHDAPLRIYGAGDPDADARAIARHTAVFVKDGATLQFGIGKAPLALATELRDRRGLRLHSGMLSDGVIDLVRAGALAADHPHVGMTCLGSEAFYAWAAGQDVFRLFGCDVTHDIGALAAIDGLIAVNSALEVDLFGQANLESANGVQVSGCGGAPDFSRGARLSTGGVSIVALPSTFGAGAGSRIRPMLSEPGLASLPRHDIDVVITEHGAADLRDLPVPARAEALIAIAAPGERAALRDAWGLIAQRLRL
jgi:acyl-CoA hydrolase